MSDILEKILATKREEVASRKAIRSLDDVRREAESMPQLYSTHYFNILNLFGIGCSNYKVSTVEEHQRKYMTANGKFYTF